MRAQLFISLCSTSHSHPLTQSTVESNAAYTGMRTIPADLLEMAKVMAASGIAREIIIVCCEPAVETAALQHKLRARVAAPARRLCCRAGRYLLSLGARLQTRLPGKSKPVYP